MEHSRLTIWSLFFLVASCGSVFAQRKPVLPPPVDSLITVGYATGSMKTISGSVEKITETQMNKDQITNPLEATHFIGEKTSLNWALTGYGHSW